MPEEITAEYTAAELNPDVTLRVRIKTTVACKTDLGRVRENNEDKFEYFIPSVESVQARRGDLYLVCDGMGGHNAGQIASELAVKTFIDTYYSHPGHDPGAAARSAGDAANRYVYDVGLAIPSRRGMGTTLTCLLLVQDKAYCVQVGDSRLYRVRDGQIAQISPEHTWIEDVVQQGMMTREEAEKHQYRHVITRAIGTEATVPIDVIELDLMVGDLFLLCSDGLTNHLRDDRLLEVLTGNGPSEAVWKLVNEALADGGSDNCTAMVVRVDAIDPV